MSDSSVNNGARGWLAAGRERLSTHERIMLAVVAITLAASCFLLSAGEGIEAGHQPWRSGSVLRVLTTLMTFEFQYPTRQGVEVKWLVEGLGAAVALLVAATAWCARARQDDNGLGRVMRPAPLEPIASIEEQSRRGIWSCVAPATLSQMALVALGLWAISRSPWAPWPEAAFGESLRALIAAVWAIALGRTLSRQGARGAATAMALVLAVTAAVGIWYHIERAPYQRLKFPIGNPIFLAACLIPGITLSLAALAGAVIRPRSSAGDLSERGSRARLIWLVIGSTFTLIALGWAFHLADSRGPQIALPIGLGVAACVLVTGKRRRYLLVVILLLLVVGAIYLRVFGWPGVVTRRLDTVLLRFYAWSYAWDLFLQRPLVGLGQGAYVLLSQHLSRPDAEYNPLVFPGELMGHAHNEWLEILADLGLVGIVLAGVWLTTTFWCAAIAIRRASSGCERWTVFGLLAAFTAIVVSEATDVALRMPGLPVIFYTVVGLIWSMSRAAEVPTTRTVRLGRPVRAFVLALALLTCGAIATVAERDWEGARCDQAVTTCAADYQWDKALVQAETAVHHRLAIEGFLSAAYVGNGVAYDAAAYRLQQLRDMLGRIGKRDKPGTNVMELAREDAALFNAYAQQCILTGQQLLARMPDYPEAAGRVAAMFLLKQEMEAIEKQLGLRPAAGTYQAEAREWMRVEYQRDRLNPEVALRLFELSADRPMAERIDLLRIPLRSGPALPQAPSAQASIFDGRLGLDLFDDFEMALASLLPDPSYHAVIDLLVAQARSAATSPDGSLWPDQYVPETLRLAARERKLTRRLAEAVALAAQAAQASEKVVDRFPLAVSNALVDLAGYLLLAYPEEPQRAVAACREAAVRQPATIAPWHARKVRKSIAIYLLASGDEAGARQCLGSLGEPVSAEQVDRLIGYGLGELCRIFANAFAPEGRPAWFAPRLERCLELVPDWPEGQFLAACRALESGNDLAGIGYLERMATLLNDPARMSAIVASLRERFPMSAALETFARTPMAGETSASQPVPTRPAVDEPAFNGAPSSLHPDP